MALINTIHGPMEESDLRKETGGHENDNEIATWVAYYHGEQLVHRSAHVTLKSVEAAASAALFT